jgi:putative nucleotidyltransferase with HDIG domain
MEHGKKGPGITRREFVASAGAAGAVGALAMAGAGATGTGAAIATEGKTPNSIQVNIPLQRPVTDELRNSVLEDLPELKNVKDANLRKKAIEAWAIALAGSNFKRLSDIPGSAMPGIAELKRGGQNVHLRGVAHFAVGIAKHMKVLVPKVDINEDVVLVGALCHDLGKAWELDPVNQKRWGDDPSRVGFASMRHPIYGAYIALTAGLPESVCHIVACHSAEGEKVVRSLECHIVVSADETWWKMTAASGLLKEETVKGLIKRFEPRSLQEAFENE